MFLSLEINYFMKIVKQCLTFIFNDGLIGTMINAKHKSKGCIMQKGGVNPAQPSGRSACARCKIDMGEKLGLNPGEISHGICPECFKIEYKRLKGAKGD